MQGQKLGALRLEASQIECQSILERLHDWVSETNELPITEKKVCN